MSIQQLQFKPGYAPSQYVDIIYLHPIYSSEVLEFGN